MYKSKQTLLVLLIVAVTAVIWLVAVTAGARNSAKQAELLTEAQVYLDDEVYVKAIPILEEAAAINSKRTQEANRLLANCYQELDQGKKYIGVLLEMIDDQPEEAALYREAADYYFLNNKYQTGLDTLKEGIEATGDGELTDYYESVRYVTVKAYAKYEDLRSLSGGLAAVCIDGKWGYIDADNDVAIPCVYDKAMDFDGGTAAVIEEGTVIFIDTDGFRTALCKEGATDIAPFGQGITSLLIGGKWRPANAKMKIGTNEYDYIGTLSNGGRAASINGKWILQNSSGEAQTGEYEGFALDEKGRAYMNGRAFAKEGGLYYLIDAKGQKISETGYEDAYPFQEADSYAAVCKDGKWGFIDKEGNEVLPFEWDSASSFANGVAAVETDGLWGYVSALGKIAIEPQYVSAKPFSENAAAVQTEGGWCLIQFKANS